MNLVDSFHVRGQIGIEQARVLALLFPEIRIVEMAGGTAIAANPFRVASEASDVPGVLLMKRTEG